MDCPWINDWTLMDKQRFILMCYMLHSCKHLQEGAWSLKVAIIQCAPYFDNVQRVFYCSQIISHNSKLQELQRNSSRTRTIITKQILALLLARPQRGRDCAKVNAFEISSIYYLWTINWSPGDKELGGGLEGNKIKDWQWNILFLDVVAWINHSHIAQIPVPNWSLISTSW